MNDAELIQAIISHPKYDAFRDTFDLHALAQKKIEQIRQGQRMTDNDLD